MAVDAFIWYKAAQGGSGMTPKGETTDDFFKDVFAFELKDFSFSVENVSTLGSATGGAGGGKIKFNEFSIKKPTDSASPLFFRNCAAGMHYEVVSIAVRKSGGAAATGMTGKPYLVFHFGTVFTTNIDWSGPGDEGPEEQIKFSFGELKIMYWPQDTTGTMSTQPKISEWSQLKNIAKFTGTPQILGS